MGKPTKKPAAARPAKKVSAVGVVEFPRYMYRADGSSEVFTSKEAFDAADDGGYGLNPGVFGIETAPAKSEQ